MRITYDAERDLAEIRFSEDRQSYDEGFTELVLVNDGTPEPTIDVQLGFDGNRLLWMSVRPASVALPADLVASAERSLRPVLGPWTLAWGNDHRPVVVENRAHLSELLKEASKDAETSQTVAELVSPAGAGLMIGLGQDRSVAAFRASAGPPYFVSRGTGSADDLLVFLYRGEWSEFTADQAISVEAATAALGEFYETGQQPSCIGWDEV